MPSLDQIDALYDATLKPRLAAMDTLRQEVFGYLVKAGLLVGIPFVLFFLSDVVALILPGALRPAVGFVSFALIFVGLAVAATKYLIPGITAFFNYRARFKQEVVAEVFKIVCPTASYSAAHGITQAVFDESGIFNTRGAFRADDRVRGTIGQTPFEASEVRRSYSTGGKNSTTIVVFHGLFFHLDFNKALRGVTIVQPADASGSAIGHRGSLTQVTLENAAFDEQFAVYASDEVEARYILTPAMMEQILALASRAGKPLYLGFKGHRAYLGVHYGASLFEPKMASTTSVEALHEMAAHFGLAEGVIHELDLNTRIWTKGVDDTLLKAPDDSEVDALDALAARGNVNTADIWKAAGADIHDEGEKDAAPAPAPPGTTVQFDHGVGGTTVRFGLTVGFFIAMLLSLAALAIGAAAARLMPTAAGMTEWAWLTSWIPEVPVASDLVAGTPIPFFIGSWILGPICWLIWTQRVRRVEVAADSVRVWRGLRPWPRRYARPPYGKVVRVEKAVFFAKLEGLSLINASLSPVLASEDEARWVAAEMRRAVRHTAAR